MRELRRGRGPPHPSSKKASRRTRRRYRNGLRVSKLAKRGHVDNKGYYIVSIILCMLPFLVGAQNIVASLYRRFSVVDIILLVFYFLIRYITKHINSVQNNDEINELKISINIQFSYKRKRQRNERKKRSRH